VKNLAQELALVSARVDDVTGARVRTLVDETARAGLHVVSWDGRNARGEAVGSGIYFYRLATPLRTLTRKMVLLK
jgi:flagellar hook assembly protein FlgD